MMIQTQTQPLPDFDPAEGMFSGWTDEEIDAYNAWADEQDRYDEPSTWPGEVDHSEPPF